MQQQNVDEKTGDGHLTLRRSVGTNDVGRSPWQSPRSKRRSWVGLPNTQHHRTLYFQHRYIRSSACPYSCRESYTKRAESVVWTSHATPGRYNCTTRSSGSPAKAYRSQKCTFYPTVKMASKVQNAVSWLRSSALPCTTSSACFTIIRRSAPSARGRKKRAHRRRADLRRREITGRRRDARQASRHEVPERATIGDEELAVLDSAIPYPQWYPRHPTSQTLIPGLRRHHLHQAHPRRYQSKHDEHQHDHPVWPQSTYLPPKPQPASFSHPSTSSP